MKVLLIGGESGLINKLIVKLRKEKHRLFLVTGQRNKNIYFEKVFERFDFPYDNENMYQIFQSVRPDLTIFMGAQDSNFHWENVRQESVRYNASLTNILMSYAMTGTGRFLYLSSAEIYQGNYPDVITEDTPVENPDFYQMVMKKAEELCQFYRENRGLDVVTLRLDRLWTVPRTGADVRDLCAQMCLQAMQHGRIVFQENHSISWLFETDAVEYVHRLIKADQRQYGLYQITSENVITERQLAEKIAAIMDPKGNRITLVSKDQAEEKTVLSNQRYADDIGLNFFCETDKVISQTVASMQKNRDSILQAGDPAKEKSFFERLWQKLGWLFKALVPYLENLICFVPFSLLNGLAAGSEYFSRLDFFLLYVLLFALIHGQRQATVSALLATCGYIIQQMYLRSTFEVMVDYNTYVWIVQLFAVGLLVGYQHDQYHILQNEKDEEKEFLSDKIADIAEINQANMRVKESLENQIVSQSDSIGRVYNITSSLDRYLPEEVLFQAVDVLKQTIGTRDVAIYTAGAGQYARLYTATSDLSRNLGASIKLSDLGEMYRILNEGKVYINRELRADYPMMAAAIKDGDEIRSILMIWGIPWEAMTLNTANLLTVTSLLIQNAMLRAQKYLDALEQRRFSSDMGALEADAFTTMLQVYENARVRNLTEYSLLKLEAEELPAGIGLELAKRLRQSDYVGMTESGNMYILLANTSRENARIVVDRLKAAGYTTNILEVDPK